MTREAAIRQVEREYAQTREAQTRQRDARIERAIADEPKIGALLQRNAHLIACGARDICNDRDNARMTAEHTAKAIAENNRCVRALLKAHGLPEDAFDVHAHCAICKDTGYDTEEHTHRCACFERRVRELLFSDTSLQSENSFSAYDDTIFPSKEQREQAGLAKELAQAYAEQFPNNAYTNLVLMGETGLGKTYLLNAMAGRIAQRGYATLVVSGFRMLEAMRAYHFGDDGDGNLFSQMVHCPILLIDDLGTEPILRNITIEYLFILLNERLQAKRHTVIATNMEPEQLLHRYGERVGSRLLDRGAGQFIRLTGKDLRLYRVKA